MHYTRQWTTNLFEYVQPTKINAAIKWIALQNEWIKRDITKDYSLTLQLTTYTRKQTKISNNWVNIHSSDVTKYEWYEELNIAK